MRLIFICFFMILQAHANKVRITHLEFENRDREGKVVIHFDGPLEKAPELTIKEEILQVSMFDAIVWPQVNRKISLQKTHDSELKAYQFDKQTVRVRAILPFALQGMEQKIKLVLKDNTVELSFPKHLVAKRPKYDESYLDYLLEKKNEAAHKRETSPKEVVQDKIQTVQSAPVIEKKSFDVMAYIGKYIAFLGLVLIGVYGFVWFLRKVMIKKGKLGFLNDTDLVSVLSTIYLGPKRSLLVVKVHNKILLLGNSETGINYLSELQGISDLLKEGEKEIGGGNFDTTIHAVDEEGIEKKVKLKKEEAPGQESKASSLSEQIKQKIKDLRPLQ